MSVVTDVIITCSLGEEYGGEDIFPAIDDLNKYLESENKGKLNNLGKHGGGFKAFQCDVFGGAFNGLDIEDFAKAIKNARWNEPENVTILIQGEEDEAMREIRLVKETPFNTKADELRSALLKQ